MRLKNHIRLKPLLAFLVSDNIRKIIAVVAAKVVTDECIYFVK
jgi:hypothetical protein